MKTETSTPPPNPFNRFEKASSAHEAAKEMVTLAEEGFVEKGMQFDAAWQEMLNHATNRVSYFLYTWLHSVCFIRNKLVLHLVLFLGFSVN